MTKLLKWVIVLLLILTASSCRTVEREGTIVFPELNFNLQRPELATIPDLKTSDMTSEQQAEITAVLVSYNTDLVLLTSYIQELENYLEVQKEYYETNLKILNEKSFAF